VRIPAVKPAGILEPLKFLAITELYKALLTDAREVASLNLESSNQLFEALEEWNATLERQCVLEPRTTTIIYGSHSEVPKGFQGSFGGY
jgi:hypothetical protein